MYPITPILTLLFPTVNESIISEADAFLLRVKVVRPSRASLDAIDDDSQDDSQDDGNRFSKTFVSPSIIFGTVTYLGYHRHCMAGMTSNRSYLVTMVRAIKH